MDRIGPRLTPQETECLRALGEHRYLARTAHALGIAESTLKSHLASARRKLGVTTSYDAVIKAFESKVPHPNWASPAKPIPGLPDKVDQPTSDAQGFGSGKGVLNEARETFEQEALSHLPSRTPRTRGKLNDLTAAQRLLLIVGIFAATIIALALFFTVADGVQRWANTLNPYQPD